MLNREVPQLTSVSSTRSARYFCKAEVRPGPWPREIALRKCREFETDHGDIAVRQLRKPRSSKINMSSDLRPYMGNHGQLRRCNWCPLATVLRRIHLLGAFGHYRTELVPGGGCSPVPARAVRASPTSLTFGLAGTNAAKALVIAGLSAMPRAAEC